MKKVIYIVLATVLVGLGVWYIVNRKASLKGDTKIVLNIIGENSSTIQALMELEQEYETSHPNIDLKFHPNSFDDAFNKSNQDFANKTGIYDIILQYNFSLASFVENKYVYKLDEMLNEVNIPDSLRLFEKDIFPEAWKEVSYYKNSKNGKIEKIGYPFATNTNILVYNKNLFEDQNNQNEYKKIYGKALNVPATWEDFFNTSKFFTQPKKGQYGFCFQGADTWVYGEFVNFLFSMGGKVMDKQYGWDGNRNTPILLNNQDALKALKFYLSLKRFSSGTFSNVDMFKQSEIMREGKTALGLQWSDALYPSYNTQKGFLSEFGFAPIPGNVSILTGGTYFVNKQTRNLPEVVNYIIYLMQHETQVKLAEKGLCSPLKSVYESPKVKKLPYINAVKTSLERGIYMMEAGVETNIISAVMSKYLQEAWLGKISAEEALNKMQNEIETKRTKLYNQLNK